MKSYKQRKYEQALIETFLKFDELLRMEKVDNFLKQNANTTKKEGKLDVKFEKSEESKSIDIKDQKASDKVFDYENSVKNKKSKSSIENFDHNEKSLNKMGTMGNEYSLLHSQLQFSSLSLNRNKLDKEDLSAKENSNSISNSNYNSNSKSKSNNNFHSNDNSPNSKKISEDSISNDTLTFFNKKLHISRHIDSSDCIITQNYDTLIARDMGTTANILLIKNNQLYIANVGDSMAVLFKNGQAIRLNEEHKVTLASELARINKSGARIINNRIEGRLNLTRAIGIIYINIILLTHI